MWPAFSWPMFDAGPRTAPITAATVHQGWRASPCETDQCRYGVIESLSIANDQLGRAALPQPKQLRRQPPTLTRRRRRWLHSQKGRRPDPARGCLCDSGLTEAGLCIESLARDLGRSHGIPVQPAFASAGPARPCRHWKPCPSAGVRDQRSPLCSWHQEGSSTQWSLPVRTCRWPTPWG